MNLLTRHTKGEEQGRGLPPTKSNSSTEVMVNRALHGPIHSTLHATYQLNSGSSKPLFVSAPELVTELYLEKKKLQELVFLEMEEEFGGKNQPHMQKKLQQKRVSLYW